MNKVKNIGLVLLCGLVLAACGKTSSSTLSTNKPSATTKTEVSETTKEVDNKNDSDEITNLSNLDEALEKLKTGDITEISGSDFIVGEDIEPGRYIIKPAENGYVQFKIHSLNGDYELYGLTDGDELKAFKLAEGERIELTVKSERLEAELLNDDFSSLSKGETAYISGSDTIIGTDIPSGQYTIAPAKDEYIQFKIYDANGDYELHGLSGLKDELKSFKLAKGEKIEMTVASEILKLTKIK